MTTTSTDTPPDREARREEFRRLLKEDSPEGDELRRLRDAAREMLGLEPLYPECEDEESESSKRSDPDPRDD